MSVVRHDDRKPLSDVPRASLRRIMNSGELSDGRRTSLFRSRCGRCPNTRIRMSKSGYHGPVMGACGFVIGTEDRIIEAGDSLAGATWRPAHG